MKSLLSFRRREVLLSLLTAAVLLCTYAPLIGAKYGFGDDFVLLLSEEPLEERMFLMDGRPVYALGSYFIHRNVHAVVQFGFLRLLAAAAVTTIALIFFRQIKRLGGARIEHVAAAIALGTLPCLHTYVAQAYLAVGICASIPVLLAAVVVFNATDNSSGQTRFFKPQYLAACLLMLVGSSTYQPMLSWYWPMVMIFLLDRRFLVSARYRNRVYTTIALGLIYFALCFAAFKLYFVIFDTYVKPRTHLTRDPIDKLYWFFRIQLPLALNYWHLMDSSRRVLTLGIASISLLFIIFGFVISSVRYLRSDLGSDQGSRRRSIWLRAVLITAVVLLSHVHWLVLDFSPQSYRLIAALGATAFVLLYWSFRQVCCLIEDTRRRIAVRRATLAITAFLCVLTCQHYSEKYWIAPHSTAYRYLLMTLRDGVSQQIDHIHLVRQAQDESYVNEWFIECFGRPTTERTWSIEGMVESGLRDSGVQHQIKTITHGMGNEPIPAGPSTLVIDMRKLKLFRISL